MCLHSSRGGSPGGCQGMGWGLSGILFQGATDSHSPPCSSWHQGKAPKANLWLNGEVGNGFSVSAFGTHMERCDPAPPVMAEEARPQQEKQVKTQTGLPGKKSKEHLTGNYKVVETGGVRKEEKCSFPVPLATHVFNSMLLLSFMNILKGYTYPSWENRYPHTSLPVQANPTCANVY